MKKQNFIVYSLLNFWRNRVLLVFLGAFFRILSNTYFCVKPGSGIFKHHSFLGVSRFITIDTLFVNFFLKELFHFVGLGYIDGQFTIIVDSWHIGLVFKEVPENSFKFITLLTGSTNLSQGQSLATGRCISTSFFLIF